MPCIHVFVSGRVQGVFYRQSTVDKAQSLGLSGWVRNCDDGRVELIAAGEQELLDALLEWLWQGPPLAKVTIVDAEPAADPGLTTFAVKH